MFNTADLRWGEREIGKCPKTTLPYVSKPIRIDSKALFHKNGKTTHFLRGQKEDREMAEGEEHVLLFGELKFDSSAHVQDT